MNPSERGSEPQAASTAAAALAAPKPGELAGRIATALVLGQLALPSVDEWHRLIEAEPAADHSPLYGLLARWTELGAEAEALRAQQIRKAMGQGVA